MGSSIVTISVAALFLLLCVGTFWWGSRVASVGQRQTVYVFAWLCAALTTALVIFSLFPATEIDGSLFGYTLGGAGAFVVLVWTVALRSARRAAPHDRREARDARRTASAMSSRPPQTVEPSRPSALGIQEVHLYRLPQSRGKARSVGLVTGDIRRVRGVDVWVNSENTDMLMSRPHEFSVSAIIRYEGARHDSSGRLTEDLVAKDLAKAVEGGCPVAPGTAVVTTSGELGGRNGVHHIIHVAAVQGSPGAGFSQIPEIGRCVYHALAQADRLDRGDGQPVRTVLFPLLGVGEAGAELDSTARTLLTATADYLTTTPGTRLRTVYFLAYSPDELSACLKAFDSTGHTSEWRQQSGAL